jgi:crotonobetainyl-CoA:carnitine CoA-transferase CaiB-like acyl-CoA transferase
MTGNLMVQAVLMALYSRKRTGRGQLIDVTMLDAAATWQLPRLIEHFDGLSHEPRGSSSFLTAPNRAFLCEDGRWIGVSVTSESEWNRFCQVMDLEGLLSDERLADNSARMANRVSLEEILDPLFAARPQSYWILHLRRADLPFGVPMDWDTIRYHQQAIENEYIVEVDTSVWGSVWTGGPPWRFSKTPARMVSAPIPGNDTFDLKAEIDSCIPERGSST